MILGLSKKRVLHIVSDEKFIDSAFNDFENCNFFNNYFIIVGKKRKLRFIKITKVYFINTYLLFYLMPFFSLFFSLVVFHSIRNDFDKKLILKISRRTKIHWISWGFDLIGLIYDRKKLFGLETSRIMNYYYDTEKVEFPELSINSQWLNRVDLISTVLPNEYDLITSNFSYKENKYFKWNYSSLNELIPKNFHFNSSASNIMLGHSGSPFLNHVDFFPTLKNKLSDFQSIVLPMSYGDEKYIKKVSRIATLEFSNKLICLSSFLPYLDYLEILSSCKILIMPGIRQIGLGNILIFLYFGKPVYLDSKSPTYKFFKLKGFPVFDINDFEHYNNNDVFDVDLKFVRSTLKLLWGDNAKDESMFKLFKYLEN